MFNQKEIDTIQNCISNYVETAKSQLDSLTVGAKGCNELAEFYESKINDCYEVQQKLNEISFTENTTPVKREILTPGEIEKIESSINNFINNFLNKK